ncbi:MAG: thioredoxin family protein [Woeseiaceae bacterium]
MTRELYYSPYCTACADPRRLDAESRDAVVWKDITEHLAEAVSLGIVQPPALVIDGRVVAQGRAALQQLADLARPR